MVGVDGVECFGSCALLVTIPGDAREKSGMIPKRQGAGS